MDHDSEVRECEEVVAWAAGKPRATVEQRLAELLKTNMHARELFGASSANYGDGPTDAEKSYLSNHTGYSRPGSENFEHDNTGSAMNYSGVEDDVMNAIAEHEGWQPGEDFEGSKES